MVIVPKAFGNYAAAMASAGIRLLALLALVLMPLGMGAPALAAPNHHSTIMSEGHCGEQQHPAPAQQQMDCKAACTALPAAAPPVIAPLSIPATPRTIGLADPFTPIVPEIATPPPKRA